MATVDDGRGVGAGLHENNERNEERVIVSETPLRLNADDPPLALLEVFYAFNSFRAVAPPVLLTMILSALAVVYVRDPVTGEVYGGVQAPYLVLNETAATSGGQAVGFAAINALVIVSVIAALTFVLVLCIYLDCWCFVGGYMIVAITAILGLSTSIIVLIGLEYYYVQVDLITFVVFFANFALGGVMVLFSHEINFWGEFANPFPPYLAQSYLVLISTVVAYVVSTIFPYYTTWALLIVLALYDLCAVLTPCGPLKLLINVADSKAERGQDLALPSALLYSTDVQNNVPGHANAPRNESRSTERNGQYNAGAVGIGGMFVFMAESNAIVENAGNQNEHGEQRIPHYVNDNDQDDDLAWIEERNSIKLGLGDFIFYSVLTAVSAEFGFTACLSVICCILTGLAGTLVLLSVFQQALPALPISIALGVSSYFLANFFVSPFADGITSNLIAV